MCYNCSSKGHYASNCPAQATGSTHKGASADANDSGGGDIHDNDGYDFTFAQTGAHPTRIPTTWILLDSQSTVSVFKDKRFLSDIRSSPQPLTVYTNGGTQVSTLVGDLNNFGPVWYNPASLANILSLAEVRLKCCVTMETAIEAAMLVHKLDGSVMKFHEYQTGLYYHDVAVERKKVSNNDVIDYSFVNTVAGNKERFHRREIEGADRARELYKKIGRPSQKQFEHILSSNIIRNCPLSRWTMPDGPLQSIAWTSLL